MVHVCDGLKLFAPRDFKCRGGPELSWSTPPHSLAKTHTSSLLFTRIIEVLHLSARLSNRATRQTDTQHPYRLAQPRGPKPWYTPPVGAASHKINSTPVPRDPTPSHSANAYSMPGSFSRIRDKARRHLGDPSPDEAYLSCESGHRDCERVKTD